MSKVVLDCSVAVSWCFKDEASEETDNLLLLIQKEGAVVPSLWHLEFGNVLLQAEKKNRISKAQIISSLELIRQLPITTDSYPLDKLLDKVILIALNNNLTTYDANYLELAMRLGLPLVTKDKELFKAANKLGIKSLPN